MKNKKLSILGMLLCFVVWLRRKLNSRGSHGPEK